MDSCFTLLLKSPHVLLLSQSHWMQTSSPFNRSRNGFTERSKEVQVLRMLELRLGLQNVGTLTHTYASLSEGCAKLQGSCMVKEKGRVVWSPGQAWWGKLVLAECWGLCWVWQKSAGRTQVPGSEAGSCLVAERSLISPLSLAVRLFKTPVKGTSEQQVQSLPARDTPAIVPQEARLGQ